MGVGSAKSDVASLFLGVRVVSPGDQRVVEEDLLSLTVRYSVFFPVLALVSIVPVEPRALLKVVVYAHVRMYMTAIYSVSRWPVK